MSPAGRNCDFEPLGEGRLRCRQCGAERQLPPGSPRYILRCPEGGDSFDPHPLTDPCVHFGAVLRQGVCDTCGQRGKPYDVHACAIHGECQLRPYQRQKGPKCCCWCAEYDPEAYGES